MTQDYRKRAFDFLETVYTNKFEPNTAIEILESIFRDIQLNIAQEARREENEACAKAVEKANCDPKCIPFGDHISSCQWSMLPEKIIRSRMEGK